MTNQAISEEQKNKWELHSAKQMTKSHLKENIWFISTF